MDSIDLLKYTETGGCSAKIPAKELENVLKNIVPVADPNVMVAIETGDDAGVYRISDDMALIFTTDFFPPVCSDPYEFGRIAATNSMSDVYAMGGEVIMALNISLFPKDKLPLEAYAQIIKGGNDCVLEAGAVVLGGHTINNETPIFGLAVVGKVAPNQLVTNSGVRVGDRLILTKPIGSGIVLAAHKLGFENIDDNYLKIKDSMALSNRRGAAVMRKYGVRGGTDVTGFGLLGHARKMAQASGVQMVIDIDRVPLFAGVRHWTAGGCIPCAAFKNLDYAGDDCTLDPAVTYDEKMILCDAQTSGGLLFSIAPEKAEDAVNELIAQGYPDATIIGEVYEFAGKPIRIRR